MQNQLDVWRQSDVTADEHYRRFGYTVLRQVLPRDLIEDHKAAFRAAFRRHGLASRSDWDRLATRPVRSAAFSTAAKALHRTNQASLRLCMNAQVRDLIAAAFDEEPVMIDAWTAEWDLKREPHVDNAVLYRDPPEKSCTVWCALEEVDADNAPIYVYPGTQRTVRDALFSQMLASDPTLGSKIEALAHGSSSEAAFRGVAGPILKRFSDLLEEWVAGRPRIPLLMKPGDLAIFSTSLVHGTMPYTDSDRTRMAMMVEYQARSVWMYPFQAYACAEHDHRRPENGFQISGIVEDTPLGAQLRPDSELMSRLWRQPLVLETPPNDGAG